MKRRLWGRSRRTPFAGWKGNVIPGFCREWNQQSQAVGGSSNTRWSSGWWPQWLPAGEPQSIMWSDPGLNGVGILGRRTGP